MSRKNSTFWDAYKSWTGAQMLFRQKWKKLDTQLVLFTVSVKIVASLIGMSSIHLRVGFQVEIFSNWTPETSAIGFQTDVLRRKMILHFLWLCPADLPSSFRDSYLSLLLKCASLWRHRRLVSIISSKVFWHVLWKSPCFSTTLFFSKFGWWALSMQWNFISYRFWIFQSLFLASIEKNFEYAWKPISPFL